MDFGNMLLCVRVYLCNAGQIVLERRNVPGLSQWLCVCVSAASETKGPEPFVA